MSYGKELDMSYCPSSLSFSKAHSDKRVEGASKTLGEGVVRRVLAFALFLMGARREDIARHLSIPLGTLFSLLTRITKHGLPAVEDRRQRHSDFLAVPKLQRPALKVTSRKSGIVLDFGGEGRAVSIPVSNVLQTKVFLLTLLQNGLLGRAQAAGLLGYSSTHTARMARQLTQGDVEALLDKRRGQTQDYLVTPEVKAELVQQFTVDVIAGGKTSGEAISAELQDRCDIAIPPRTVRHHLARMGTVGHPAFPAAASGRGKKNFQRIFRNVKHNLPALAESLSAYAGRALMQQKIERRACLAALSTEGIDHRVIAIFTQTHQSTVGRWVCRVQEGGLFTDLPRSGRPRSFSEASRLTTIAVYCQHAPPLPGVHTWSLRDAHNFFNEHPEILGAPIGRATIGRILLEHAVRPHRQKYYLQITDPDFFPKMEHIVDLYLNPPQNLFCFDECTCIQARNRLTPDLPAIADQPIRQDPNYRRNGTTDLLAFLEPATGQVYGECTANHDRHTLCRVFTGHVQTLPPDAVIHYVMDNLSTHYHEDFCQTVAKLSGVAYTPLKTGAERRQWLQSGNKRIAVHFVPFHASWLNMVEIWFGILKSKCLKYGHFFSVEQLCQDISAFIETWDEHFAHPFSWSYTGEGLHAKAVRRFCRLLAIETDQMDCRFLKSQLLLMSNIAENYIKLIPAADWLHLLHLAVEKNKYVTRIIENDPKPRRKKMALRAYERFCHTVIEHEECLARAS